MQDPEPLPSDDPLLDAPNVIVVPHIGSATHSARERMTDLAVDNLLAAIESKREPDGPRFLFGLGIRHVGIVTAKDLLKCFGTIEELRRVALSEGGRQELSSVQGVGPVVGEALVDFVHEAHNREAVEIFLYSNDARADAMTARLKARAEQ